MIETTRPEEVAPDLRVAATSAPPRDDQHGALQRWLLLWSSLVFAFLQNLCAAYVAVSSLRLVVGFSSIAAALGARIPFFLHADRIRIPMMLFALAGALINLSAIRRVRRLRNRPAAQWRAQPVPAAKLRSENLQLFLVWATLALLSFEEVLHLIQHHHP